MFIQGLKHGAYVITIALIAVAALFQLDNEEIAEAIIGAIIIISWLVVDYFFKRSNGSIFSIAINAKKIKSLWHYILGVGLAWGPAKLFIAEFPIPDAHILLNLFLAILAIPLAGASVLGAVIVGGFFYRENENDQ